MRFPFFAPLSLLLFFSPLLAGEKTPISGGLSNQNFMEYLDEQPVFVKYKPSSTQVLGTSWEQEVQATCHAQTLGLCPPLLWIDREKQSMAFYFLKDARSYTGAAHEINLLCESLRLLHSQSPKGPTFIPSEQIRSEINLFEASTLDNQRWIIEASKLLFQLDANKELFPFEFHPCHLDLWTPNIVCTGDPNSPRLWVLDWEYAADSDPDYDLAVFIMLDSLKESDELELLSEYGKSISPAYKNRMIYMKSLACLRIASWYATKSVICDKKEINPESWIYLERARALLSELEPVLAPKLEELQ